MPDRWTAGLLKKHFDALRAADATALIAALAAVSAENRKSEAAAEKRFDLLNELRSGVSTKDQHDALEKRIDSIEQRIDRTEGSAAGAREQRSDTLTGRQIRSMLLQVAVGISLVIVAAATLVIKVKGG